MLGRSTSPAAVRSYDLVMVTNATPLDALDGRLITALAELLNDRPLPG